MAKKYSVTPRLQHGRKYYIATFYNASGKRVTRGLGTTEKTMADVICTGLALLWTLRVKSAAERPAAACDESVRLYFDLGEDADDLLGKEVSPEAAADLIKAGEFAAQFPQAFRRRIKLLYLELLGVRHERDGFRLEVAGLTKQLDLERSAHTDLKTSAIGRAVRSVKNVPSIAVALQAFKSHMLASSSKGHAEKVNGVADAFAAALPAETKTLAQVTVDQVSGYIDRTVMESGTRKQAAYRRHVRMNVGRLINWSAGRWEYPSQMSAVPAVKKHAVARDRGEIDWHSLKDVQAALKAIPERLAGRLDVEKKKVPAHLIDYWRALVGMLGFAGLQLAELIWLRRSDLEISGDRAKVWVTTVEDAEVPGISHALKTGHRRRHVDVHPRLLLPLLKNHLKGLQAGGVHLFPLPSDVRVRKRAKNPGAAERWLMQSLSTMLRGHAGSAKLNKKGEPQRKPTPGLLPKGMNAKSLRRTFGSLLLRSGKSTAEVAAAMGNTEEIVRQHYARILGCEVDVDF